MSEIEMKDMTGEPPSLEDVQRAKYAVKKVMVGADLMKLPAQLAVEIPNILRCLWLAEAYLQAREEKKNERTRDGA